MAYERLQALGPEKFQKIINDLMRGASAMGTARVIQQEWKEFQDVAEKTLTQQLNRLRVSAAEGMFGKKVALQIVAGATPQIKLLAGISHGTIERLEELSNIQRLRVMDLVKAEKSAMADEKGKIVKFPMAALLTATNAVFADYSKLLQDIQKVRFDLGLDEYRGVVPTMRGAASSVTLPDGTNIQKQVYEAATTIEDIFNQRKIPLAHAPDL